MSEDTYDVRRAVANVVAYSWNDELTDLIEQVRIEGAVPQRHILFDLLVVSNWITGQSVTVEQVLSGGMTDG